MAELPHIKFFYIKSGAFRVVHADGVVGGPTPNGHIHVSFFSERHAIPQMVEHEVRVVSDTIAELGPKVTTEGKDGIVREIEVGVMMDVPLARVLYKWLGEHIEKMSAGIKDDAP